MKNLNAIPRLFGSSAAYGLVFAMASIGALAQDTTKLSVKDGVSTYTTEVRDAEVVYVQGNNLVLKLEDGKVEHLVVPDSDKFTIGSKEVSVNELQPGTTLTQTIVTSTTPRYVNTVRTIKGKVWHATPTGRVIVTLPDGTNQVYQIPGDAKVNVKGKPQRAFGLRKGMTFEATIVSDDSHSVIERSKSVVGEIPTPATPHLLGFLVIQQPAVSFEPTQAVETEASAEKLPAELPKTGTMQPLAGVIGALALLSSLGLGFARRKFTV